MLLSNIKDSAWDDLCALRSSSFVELAAICCSCTAKVDVILAEERLGAIEIFLSVEKAPVERIFSSQSGQLSSEGLHRLLCSGPNDFEIREVVYREFYASQLPRRQHEPDIIIAVGGLPGTTSQGKRRRR